MKSGRRKTDQNAGRKGDNSNKSGKTREVLVRGAFRVCWKPILGFTQQERLKEWHKAQAHQGKDDRSRKAKASRGESRRVKSTSRDWSSSCLYGTISENGNVNLVPNTSDACADEAGDMEL